MRVVYNKNMNNTTTHTTKTIKRDEKFGIVIDWNKRNQMRFLENLNRTFGK